MHFKKEKQPINLDCKKLYIPLNYNQLMIKLFPFTSIQMVVDRKSCLAQ